MNARSILRVLPLSLFALAACRTPETTSDPDTAPPRIVPYSWAAGTSGDVVVRVSVAPLRRDPSHGSEQVDQVILGTTLRVLSQERGFAKVETPYEYEGWIPINLTADRTEANARYWEERELMRHEAPFGFVRERPSPDARPVCDLVLGARVLRVSNQGEWSRVLLPDGREGYVPSNDLAPLPEPQEPDLDRLVDRALSLQGVPYLWGGHSSKGFDCSGYTRTLYALEGVSLPRDSRQQVEIGTPIEPSEGYANLRKGDLLFFGSRPDRITHVALSLGGPRFVHCSGDVHVRSLDENEPDFDKGLRDRLQAVRRIVE